MDCIVRRYSAGKTPRCEGDSTRVADRGVLPSKPFQSFTPTTAVGKSLDSKEGGSPCRGGSQSSQSDDDDDDFQKRRRPKLQQALRRKKLVNIHEVEKAQRIASSSSASRIKREAFEAEEEDIWGDQTLFRLVTVPSKDTGVYVQKKVRVVDHTLPQLMRIPPPPVPLSWCRSVKPYRKRVMAPEPDCRVVREGCIAEMNFNALRREETYVAVLINPDWVVEESDDETVTDKLHCLKRIPLTKLCPTGFVFIWIDKGDVQKVCELMHRQNYVYVENLTWVQMLPNNKMIHGECKYTRKCHSTLYIFRKDNEGKDIELRHQRNPDVVLDCLRTSIDGHKKTPDETYKAIETLLPSFEGRALELWSSPDGPRKGWTHVVEQTKPSRVVQTL
ncbi:hypothetical protein HOP50_04g29910 [Chloropicon primus]|uniref:Uncharacterized protein n=1 Tax=Chloropicon primus TaxID=1764295 RepID=A0A5B8MJ35_9CHLO|nr:hypothetical protein A3770_04p29910 [Chloropicon primus]UPQ99683.1 hypothetical protein HOP50_04g29910 [Chloropicon primus]|eukprot:QDZ20473.1 hypothetical protein A3770_04p29910 [Chloropicon primus]